MSGTKTTLFLDHDGVIVTDKQFGKRSETGAKFDPFDDLCIIRLMAVAKTMDAEIVCSSDWRAYASIDEMRQIYLQAGIDLPLVGYTDILEPIRFKESRSEIRVREIKKYIEDNNVQKYFALDDLYLRGLPTNNWYRTSLYDGIIQSDMPKILKKWRCLP